jgi:hypothetical protein
VAIGAPLRTAPAIPDRMVAAAFEITEPCISRKFALLFAMRFYLHQSIVDSALFGRVIAQFSVILLINGHLFDCCGSFQ